MDKCDTVQYGVWLNDARALVIPPQDDAVAHQRRAPTLFCAAISLSVGKRPLFSAAGTMLRASSPRGPGGNVPPSAEVYLPPRRPRQSGEYAIRVMPSSSHTSLVARW